MDRLLKAGVDAAKAGRIEEAIKMLTRVVQNDPRSADAWFWLGMVMSDSDKKIYSFRRVLKIEPNHFEARGQLESLGYIKPAAPKKAPPPTFDSDSESVSAFADTPASTSPPTSPFSVEPEEGSFGDYYEETQEAEEEDLPDAEELTFLDDIESDEDEKPIKAKKGKKTKKNQKVLLAVLGVFAFLAITGVISLFLLQPDLLANVASAILPPTSTAVPTITPIPTIVPTPTPLPFSALEKADYTPVFEKSECSFELPETAIDVNVECGFVIVPENRYGDVNDTIRLAVAIYRGSNSAAEPIIYLQGGPGQDAVELMSEHYEYSIEKYINERDFILLDQRGMGLSEPNLDCPKLDEVYEDDSMQNISGDERERRYLSAFSECRDRLTAEGANLSSYNTMENAADVKDVILALGYEKATLFGVSYGTRLAQVVMREHPEVVYSAVLDSVLPIESKVYNESAAVAQTSLDTLFNGCAIDPVCNATYPNLEEDLREVVTKLQAKPMRTNIFGYDEDDYSRKVNGAEFMSTILWAMRDPSLQDLIPQAIKRAKAGETNMLGFILSLPIQAVNDINLGSYLSINCREQVYASTPKEVSDDLASYPDTEEVGLSWVYGNPNFIFNLCDTWQVEGIRPGENEALESDIPTLVMAGEYDSTTPPFWAEQVSLRLPRATYVEFPGQGHGVAFTQDTACPREILQNFFANPEIAPDISCAAEMPPPEFLVPYTGEEPIIMIPIVSEESQIITAAPASWARSGDSAAFSREASSWDMTALSVQRVSLDFDTVMGALVGDFEGVGFDSYPIQVGEINANGLIWELYEASAIALPVDIAFAKDGYNTIMVLFISHTDEHDILYEKVFKEVLNQTSLIPTER